MQTVYKDHIRIVYTEGLENQHNVEEQDHVVTQYSYQQHCCYNVRTQDPDIMKPFFVLYLLNVFLKRIYHQSVDANGKNNINSIIDETEKLPV